MAVRGMLSENGLTTARISAHVDSLQRQLLETIGSTPLSDAELVNPLDGGPHARFVAFRSGQAQRWYSELIARNCITDVRGDVLRIGFGIYQDETDVGRLVDFLGELV
jgi:selenocysteine lyase/cysteine desulfurase